MHGIIRDVTDQLPYEIPASWAWVRLRDLGLFKKGPFGSSITKEMFAPNTYPNRIKVYEQKNAIKKDWTLGKYFITPEKFKELSGFEVVGGDIIVSCAGTIGEIYTLPSEAEKGVINQALMRIKLYDASLQEYFLCYFDFVLKREASNKGSGTGMKNIPPFDVLKQMLVPLPPLAEEKRIINHLNLLLAKTQEISSSFGKIQQYSSEIKTKILNEYFAIEASDKSYYSKNNENNCSGDLFTAEKYCQEIQSGNINEKRQKILAKDIRIDSQNRGWIPLSFIAEDIFGGGTPSKAEPNYWNGDIPWCSVKDLGESLIVYSTQDTITQKGLENSASKIVKKGGLILCTRLSVGEIRIAGKDMAINQDLKGVILNKVIWPMYFVYFMSSVKLPTSGTTVKGVTLKNLLSTPFPYVPMERQIEISKRIEFLYSLIDKGINQKK